MPPAPAPDPSTSEPPCPNPGAATLIEPMDQASVNALAGCEELFGLILQGALDLRPLAALRRLGNGGLTLYDVQNLDGLQRLEDAYVLQLYGAPLRSLSTLSGLRHLTGIDMRESSVVDFTGLEGVSDLQALYLDHNPELESLAGLTLPARMNSITLSGNASLRDISGLGGLVELNVLGLADNPSLVDVPRFDQLTHLGAFLLRGGSQLTDSPQFPLITTISDLYILDNPLLERFTGFAALQTANYISVSDNPDLSEIDLGALEQAGALFIGHNPGLDGGALQLSLAGVQSDLPRIAPDQSQTQFDPCPWTSDDVCDENLSCAPGTDPVCP
jgi:hypothetical protein